MKILDCTLRDGGYYVNWDFEPKVVRKYLASIDAAKIDIVEIGFRFLPVNKFLGAFAYSTDEYLSSINLPEGISVAVMVNASELIEYEHGERSAVLKLFSYKDESPVDIVRVAICANSVASCYEIVQQIHILGYRVFVNLMQVDMVDDEELLKIASLISSWGIIEVIYFADSFGSLDSSSVKNIATKLAKCWSGQLGIHAHDNKGLALSNSLAAQEVGVQYLDSTLCGMGRGAGNVKTEFLLVEMVQRGMGPYYPDALFPIIDSVFYKLKEHYRWGPNIYYYLAAIHGIHPTYVQEMLGDERYDTEQMLSAINFLKPTDSSFFSLEKMLRASAGIEGNEKGTWSAKGWLAGRTVLILGAGISTEKYIDSLKVFVKQHKPFVLCLNINEAVPTDMVDAYVACHDVRILMESDLYKKLGKPILIPLSHVPDRVCEAIAGTELLDYGMRIDKSCLDILNTGCVLPSPLAFMYAIAASTASGAERILLTGVDGYSGSDLRQVEMIDMIEKYNKQPTAIPLIAITPTTYPLDQKSIFDPDLL